MPEARSDYGKRLNQIHSRIEAWIGETPLVVYSAYLTEGDHLPVDNLDDIAVEGKVQFFAEHDSFFGDGETYTSPVVISPTWLEVAALANDMIKTTGDRHHEFLEGVRTIEEGGEVKRAELMMGS